MVVVLGRQSDSFHSFLPPSLQMIPISGAPTLSSPLAGDASARASAFFGLERRSSAALHLCFPHFSCTVQEGAFVEFDLTTSPTWPCPILLGHGQLVSSLAELA